MGLRGDHDDPGRGWAAQDILEELDKVEVAQVVHLEGGLQAIFREAPGESEHGCIAHKHVKWPEKENIQRCADRNALKPRMIHAPPGITNSSISSGLQTAGNGMP